MRKPARPDNFRSKVVFLRLGPGRFVHATLCNNVGTIQGRSWHSTVKGQAFSHLESRH